MTHSDPIANALSIIRNGQLVRLARVRVPASNKIKSVLNVLKAEGFIKSYSQETVRKGIDELIVELRYHNGQPVLREMKRISKPGRRVYAQADKLPRVFNGIGMSIISTSHGVMADHEARSKRLGGEIVCSVF
jgi:small subunit ribosomal protein S8